MHNAQCIMHNYCVRRWRVCKYREAIFRCQRKLTSPISGKPPAAAYAGGFAVAPRAPFAVRSHNLAMKPLQIPIYHVNNTKENCVCKNYYTSKRRKCQQADILQEGEILYTWLLFIIC